MGILRRRVATRAQLGYEQVQLVGHDIGLMVAYAYCPVAERVAREFGCPLPTDLDPEGLIHWATVIKI
jgi:hypothetical protein